jgi:hypothetical protein
MSLSIAIRLTVSVILNRSFSEEPVDQEGPQIAMQVMQTTVAKLEASKVKKREVQSEEANRVEEAPALEIAPLASTDPYAPEGGVDDEGLATIGSIQRFQSIPNRRSERLVQIMENNPD